SPPYCLAAQQLISVGCRKMLPFQAFLRLWQMRGNAPRSKHSSAVTMELKADIKIVSGNLKRGLEGDETATAVAEAVHQTWRNAIARAKGNIRADQKLLEKINADLASQLSLHELQEFARQVADSLKPQNLIMDVQEERKSFIYYI